jgi:hypothetical protein
MKMAFKTTLGLVIAATTILERLDSDRKTLVKAIRSGGFSPSTSSL